MTSRRPPRLALWIVERFGPGDSPLAGDLVEEFQDRPSRLRLWREVASAVVAGRMQPEDEIRPLHLVDLQPTEAQERARRFALRFRPVNLSASPIYGIGGLGLMVIVLLVSVEMPVAWVGLAASILAGVGLGALMIAHRRPRPFGHRS